MKIIVDEMPKSAKDCVFGHKLITHRLRDIKTGKLIGIPDWYCRIDNELCVLGGDCNICHKLSHVGEYFRYKFTNEK